MLKKNVGAILFLAATLAAAEPGTPIAGDYVEARSNHVYTCGCLYSGEMVTDGREAIVIWNFDRGSYRGKSLEGVRVAAVLNSEESLSLEGRARRAVLYLDGIRSDAEKDAVISLLNERYARLIGEIMAVHRAEIVFEKGPGRVSVRIPGIAEVSARSAVLPDDAHLGSLLWYAPFVPLADSTLAMTLLYEYQGADFGKRWWRWQPGITGYFGRFTL